MSSLGGQNGPPKSSSSLAPLPSSCHVLLFSGEAFSSKGAGVGRWSLGGGGRGPGEGGQQAWVSCCRQREVVN